MQILLIGSILSIFTTCGMNISILRHYHLNKHEISISLVNIIITSMFVGCFWFLSGNLVVKMFQLPKETLYLSYCIAILISFKVVLYGYYRASGYYLKILCYFTTFEAIEVCALGSFSFTHFSIDIITIITVFLWIRIIPILLSIIDVKPKLLISDIKSVICKRMRFGISFIPKDLFLWIGHSADRFIISYLIGPTSVGVYVTIYKVASIVKHISQPVTFSAFPNLAKAWDTCDYHDFHIKKWKTAGLYLLLTVPLLILFATVPSHLFTLLSKELTNSRVLLIWISVGLVIHTVQVITGYYVYVFSNKVWRYTIIISSVNVIGLFTQYYLLINWGLKGAAFGSFLIYFIMWIIVIFDSSRFYRYNFHK